MFDNRYPSQLRAKPWWLFTVLSVIALACASCNDTAQQTSQPRGRTVQSPRVIATAGMPLTDSAPPQLDVTPTVLVPQPQDTLAIATPEPTLIPTSTLIPTPTLSTSYEAESSQNTLSGGAQVINCPTTCSGNNRVGYIGLQDNGNNGTLQFNNVGESGAGSYTMTIYYTEGDSGDRTGYISVNSGPAITFTASSTGNFWVVGTVNVVVSLSAGDNTIKFSNSSTKAPDIDRIVV